MPLSSSPVLDSPSPCNGRVDDSRRARGIVRTSVTAFVRAPRDRVAALFLDYTSWPRTFAATIAHTRLVRRERHSLVVMVDHRRDGRVINVLTDCGAGVVALKEFKRRFDATFVNRFAHADGGTLYTVDAEVHIKQPFTPLAPLLTGIVRRALRRYTLAPVRDAAERAGDGR